MKKKYFLFILCFKAFSYSPNLYSKLICNNNLDTVQVTIGSCTYNVEVCYSCSVTVPGSITVGAIWYLDSMQQNCIPVSQLFDNIYAYVISPEFIFNYLCPNTEPNPCEKNKDPHSYQYVDVNWYYCWKTVLILEPDNNEYRYFNACDDNAVCTYRLYYCKDENGQFQHFLDGFDGPIGEVNCDKTYSEITIPTQYGVYSECFNVMPPCGK